MAGFAKFNFGSDDEKDVSVDKKSDDVLDEKDVSDTGNSSSDDGAVESSGAHSGTNLASNNTVNDRKVANPFVSVGSKSRGGSNSSESFSGGELVGEGVVKSSDESKSGFSFKPLNLGDKVSDAVVGESDGGVVKTSLGGNSSSGGVVSEVVSSSSQVESLVGSESDVSDSSDSEHDGLSVSGSDSSVAVGSVSVVEDSESSSMVEDDGVFIDFLSESDDEDDLPFVLAGDEDSSRDSYDEYDPSDSYDEYNSDYNFEDEGSVNLSDLYADDDPVGVVSSDESVVEVSSVGVVSRDDSVVSSSSGSSHVDVPYFEEPYDSSSDDGVFVDFDDDDSEPFVGVRKYDSSEVVSSEVAFVDESTSVDVPIVGSDESVVSDRELLADAVVRQSSRVDEDSMSSVDVSVVEIEREVRREVSDQNKAVPELDKALGGTVTDFESDFFAKNVDEVLVNDSGRTARDESIGARSADGTVAKSSTGKKQRYRYLREDGRMNGAELQFFKNLQSSSAKVSGGVDKSLEEKLRAPVHGVESESDRRKRSMLITQSMESLDSMKRGSRLKFDDKDADTLKFLAMFRYATDAQLAHMFSLARATMYNRLKRLRTQGLVIDKKLYGTRPLWLLTQAGMLLSGMDLVRTTEGKMTYSMFPHQFTVNNTAAHLWGANLNVLNQPDYPNKNKTNYKGEKVFGEELTSELEILTVLSRKKGTDSASVFRPQLRNILENAFEDWNEAGGVSFGPSPELLAGNEFMWAILPPDRLRLAYHIPDLVIKRDRNLDGSPESIAVEIEISNKNPASYRKTLEAYQSDELIFKKVIWVCKGRGPAQKLEDIARDIGLWQQGRIEIVPIVTEDGVFRGRDLWTL